MYMADSPEGYDVSAVEAWIKKNIALAMVDINFSKIGLKLKVEIESTNVECEVIEKPFFDPKKQITSKSL